MSEEMSEDMPERMSEQMSGEMSEDMPERMSGQMSGEMSEGMHIPSQDVDLHKMSLIKLLLFKPLGEGNDMDEKGNPLDPYRTI